jgi:8-oxo-dGTP diphosphatase
MTPSAAITIARLRHLAARARADGVTCLNIAVIIEDHGRILLLARGGDGSPNPAWEPPRALLPAGESPLRAISRALTPASLAIDQITGYLGHHDTAAGTGGHTRVFYVSATAADPASICRTAAIGHLWARPGELPGNTSPAPRTLAQLAGGTPAVGCSQAGPIPPLAGPLRACAAGVYPDEAGVELLISHGVFLHREDFTSRFVEPGTHITDGTQLAAINWPAAISALGTGLACSGGEQRMLRLAASLAYGLPVNLRDAFTGIDDRGIKLVIRAVLHASGQRPPEEIS